MQRSLPAPDGKWIHVDSRESARIYKLDTGAWELADAEVPTCSGREVDSCGFVSLLGFTPSSTQEPGSLQTPHCSLNSSKWTTDALVTGAFRIQTLTIIEVLARHWANSLFHCVGGLEHELARYGLKGYKLHSVYTDDARI